jgi:unsaturated chondroitin disaccharide hydrolase
MKKLRLVILLLCLHACSQSIPPNQLSDHAIQIRDKLRSSTAMISELRTDDLVSPRSVEHGEIVMVSSSDWTSGFYPGELWMMYGLTSDDYWKEEAIDFTLALEQEKWNGKTHDMGFKMYCSFGKAWDYTQNDKYRDILIQSAKTLATRFKPNVGCIRSWDHNSDKWDFPVIIDNMMNLELLFWAAQETGNELFKEIAICHAETTMNNHFREDFSSYHVVDYNPVTGEVQQKNTHQGHSDESAWSRGQAWGLYGYTMVYRKTGDQKFLRHAENIADYILNHPNLPENYIPYWDFDAPNIPDEPYDASAAAIIGSALYELSTFSQDGALYLTAANQIFDSLMSPEFLADPLMNNGFILKHSTGSKAHSSEVDVPLVYADYYFIEMLLRQANLTKGGI